MEPVNRREFIGMAGAASLTALVSTQLPAQPPPTDTAVQPPVQADASVPHLMEVATKVADTSDVFGEDYLWLNNHTLLLWELIPDSDTFRAALVDTHTGERTLPQEFNARNNPFLKGRLFRATIEGSNHWEEHYLSPRTTASFDGRWILWQTAFPASEWIAATIDGEQRRWNKDLFDAEVRSADNQAFWLRDGKRWAELVSRYQDETDTLPRANIYELGNDSPIKSVPIEGLRDGLPVGVTHDGKIMMFHPRHPSRTRPTEFIFSLVSLDADAVTAQQMGISLPPSTGMWEVKLSHQGDRLAWILIGEDEDRLRTLCVSNVDGTEMRTLGSAGSIKIGPGRYSSLGDLTWLPDGTGLSFTYNRAIWVLTV